MEQYLESTEFIDWQHPTVKEKASVLADGCAGQTEIVRRCFEWVRDEIRHSGDHLDTTITYKASEVLAEGTGFCYAKSHLLAAILRANGIPAGLCYQRLSVDENGAPFCLHGLNAVYLPEIGWYRVDPRGNRPGVDAQFTPPIETLAFGIKFSEEADLPEIWTEPLPIVIAALRNFNSYGDGWSFLPDVPLIQLVDCSVNRVS